MKNGFLIFCFFISVKSFPQDSAIYRQIHLHLDKPVYVAGDTMWFKAYVISDFFPDLQSKNLFIDLVDKTGSRVLSQRLPILSGVSWGHINLPDTLQEGWYILRTYSASQLNSDHLYYRPVAIFNPGKKAQSVSNSGTPDKKNNTLIIQEHEKGKLYTVTKNNLTGIPSVVEGYMYGEKIFQQKIQPGQTEIKGVIPANALPSGLLEVKLLDEKNTILAKAVSFINHKEFYQPAVLLIDRFSTEAKSENVFTFSFPDSIDGNFSISVTDADKEIQHNQANIFSDYLLYPYSSYHQFGYESFLTKDSLEYIDEVLSKTFLPDFTDKTSLPDPDYITIKGKVSLNNKTLKKGNLSFMIRSKDSTSIFINTPINSDGSFVLDNLIFQDTAEFFYQTNKQLAPDITIESFSLPALKDQKIPEEILRKLDRSIFSNPSAYSLATKIYSNNIDISQKKGLMREVVIVTKKLSPSALVNKRYTTGVFGNTTMVKTYDFINEPPATFSGNIFDWMQGRVAGLEITRRSGLRYELYSRRSVTLTGSPIPAKLYLNEVEQDNTSSVASIPLNQIALVKYFLPGYHPFSGAGLSPVLAVYTKNHEDMPNNNRGFLKKFTYPGYSVSNDFYSPEYSTLTNVPDKRITLLWEPAIVLERTNTYTIRFYNSDEAKRFHIVFEGVTSDGRLVHIDQIIE